MRDPAAFEEFYRREPDPWHFATSAYERGRYDAVVAVLDRPRYRSAYEPGCSVGVLTELLADRVDRLRAVDLSPTAVARARERCIDRANVEVAVGALQDPPGSGHDLVVLSEVGYYLEVDALTEAIDDLVGSLVPGGQLVGCHWLGHSDDHVLHGDTVHEVVDRHPDLRHRTHQAHEGFRIDTWTRS